MRNLTITFFTPILCATSLLTASVPNLSDTNLRTTSQQILIQSTLIASFRLLADEDIGQLYDVQITQNQLKMPHIITAKTTKKLKIVIDWNKLLSAEPEASMYEIQEKPKPSSNIYVCIDPSNTWRIVAHNCDENSQPLPSIKLEIYQDMIKEEGHQYPTPKIAGPYQG